MLQNSKLCISTDLGYAAVKVDCSPLWRTLPMENVSSLEKKATNYLL
jgi:hypothetical protein